MPVDRDLTHGILLELHPLPRRHGDQDAMYRLKQALKTLLRAYRFRAGYFRDLEPGEEPFAPSPSHVKASVK